MMRAAFQPQPLALPPSPADPDTASPRSAPNALRFAITRPI